MSTPETLLVQDTNCTQLHRAGNPRRHEIIIDGLRIEIPFEFHQKVELPFAQAMKFTVDSAFHVTDEDGKTYEAVKKARDTSLPMTLAPNEVVAELHELTQDALLRRAAIKPGGEKLTKSTKKTIIEAFLEGVHATERAPVADTDSPEGGMGTTEMSTAELDEMFETAAA